MVEPLVGTMRESGGTAVFGARLGQVGVTY